MTDESLSKEHLDREKVRAETEKIRNESKKILIEQSILSGQATTYHRRLELAKVVISGAGVIAALGALVGALITYFQWKDGQERARREEKQKYIIENTARVFSGRPDDVVLGLHSLISELRHDKPDQNKIIIIAISHALATNNNATVRNHLLSTMRSLDPQKIGRSALDAGLQVLVETNRSKFITLSEFFGSSSDSDKSDIVNTLAFTARGISVMFGLGARVGDLSRTYLANIDFRFHTNENSLKKIKFINSVLTNAIFDYSSFVEADFTNSELDGASFICSNLRGSVFRVEQTRASDREVAIPDYLARSSIFGGAEGSTGARARLVSQLPNFENADLRGVDFNGHVIAVLVSPTVQSVTDSSRQNNAPPVQVSQISFLGADLRESNLNKAILRLVFPDTPGFRGHRHSEPLRRSTIGELALEGYPLSELSAHPFVTYVQKVMQQQAFSLQSSPFVGLVGSRRPQQMLPPILERHVLQLEADLVQRGARSNREEICRQRATSRSQTSRF